MERKKIQRLMQQKCMASEKKNLDLLATTCEKLADHYFSGENYNKALTEYKEAVATGQSHNVARCNRMISEVYFNFGEFNKAIDYGKRYLNYANLEGNKADQQRAYVTLGRTYFALASSPSVTKEGTETALRHAQKAYKRSWDLIDSITKNVTKFELMEMKAVVRLNQGLVEETQGNLSDALESFESAIDICRKNDIYEILYRCYVSLGNFYSSQNDTENALRNFSLSLNIVEKLPDKAESAWLSHSEKVKSCDVLQGLMLLKGVYFGMASFMQAKTEMLKAKQLSIDNVDIRKEMKKMLKQASTLCRMERELLDTPEHDYKARKSLFERLGDKLSHMGYYSVAVRYYLRMLESAEEAGEYGKDLCSIYVSLSQTYKDDKQYDKAIEFYKKELALWGDNPKEACQTSLNLGDTLEQSNGDYYEILEQYMNARCFALRAGCMKLEARALDYMIDLYKSNGRDNLAAEAQKDRDLLEISTDEEEDASLSEGKTPDGDEDTSSDEEEECDWPADTRRSARSQAPKLKIRTNEKGETALHRACIEGNINKVRALIDQGHPVNVRDNAGWIPLHEACNHDHREIVSLLLDRGAAIDDPGKAECDGTTPLIDAATCGHIDIMEILIDRGASLLLKTSKGETALDCLLGWYQRSNSDKLPQEFINQFQEVEHKLRNALVKAGYPVPHKSTSTNTNNDHFTLPTVDLTSQNTLSQRSSATDVSTRKKNTIGNLRNAIDNATRTNVIGNLRRNVDNYSDNFPHFRAISSDESDNDANSVMSYSNRDAQQNESMSPMDRHKTCRNDERFDRRDASAEDYVKTMKSVRHRANISGRAFEPLEDGERSAFLDPGLDADNWLEDDIVEPKLAKRRKTDARGMEYLDSRKPVHQSSNAQITRPIARQVISNESLIADQSFQTRIRRYSSSSDSADQTNFNALNEDTDYVDSTNTTRASTFDDLPFNSSVNNFTPDAIISDDDFDYDIPVNMSTSRLKAPTKNYRKHQSSLLNAGFSRNRSPSENTQFESRSRNVYPPIPLNPRGGVLRDRSILAETGRSTSFLDSVPARSETQQPIVPQQQAQAQLTQSLSIKVRIEGKLFLVPIVPDQRISFLAEEAAKRYYSIAGVKPTLSLVTKDGALLAADDPVSLIVGTDEVLTTVTSWNMPSLPERYVEACAALQSRVDVRVQRSLASCEGNQALTLCDLAMTAKQLAPVFRALHTQDRLWKMDLAGNLMKDDGLKLLSDCVSRMPDLKELNISCNYITSQGLRHLGYLFADTEPTRPLQKLTSLDLSFNLLGGDPSMTNLTTILEGASLKTLKLQSCELSYASFECSTGLMPPLLCLESIENLDISFNALGREGVAGFLGRLSTETLVSLNLAATSLPNSTTSAVARELRLFLERDNPDNLKSLNLSNNHVTDADVFDIVQSLARAPKFESLVLSNNPAISSSALKLLLSKEPPLNKLDLTGCGELQVPLLQWAIDNSDIVNIKLKSLTLSVVEDEERQHSDDLRNMWSRVWGNRAVVKKGPFGLMFLTVT